MSATTTFSITSPSSTPTPTPVLTSITISPSITSIASGSSQVYTAQGLDQNGKSMGDYTSSTTFSASGATVTGSSVSATTAGSYTVTGTCNGITSNSATLTVTAGPTTTIVVSGYPSSAMAGTSNSVTVTAYDASGNIATGYTGTVQITSSDTQALLPSNYQFTAVDAGVHSFSVTLESAGTQSITATDTLKTSITGSQTNIIVNPGTATTLMINPTSTTMGAGGLQQYTVMAYDVYHNGLDVTSSAAFSVNGSSNPTGNIISENALGTYIVTASLNGLTSNQATLTVVGGDIVTIAVSGGSSAISAGGSSAPFTAMATDKYSNTWDVTGQVTWSINDVAGHYTWTGNSISITDASPASTPWTVTATASNGVIGTSQLTVNPSDIVSIAVSGGSSAISAGGSSAPFTAMATDKYSNTWDVTGQVTWSINSAANSFGWIGSSVSVTEASVSGTPWTVTATASNGVYGTAQLTVNHDSTIADLEVAPATNTITVGGSPVQYAATASDKYSNTWDASASVTWSINCASGSYVWTGSSVSVTEASVSGTPWTVTGTASDGIYDTAQLTVNAGPATKLAITGYPSAINAGQSFGGIVLTAYDSFGNIVNGYTGSVYFTSTPSGATLPFTASSKYTFTSTDSGAHMFLGFASPSGAGSFTITATDGILSTTTNSITVITTGSPNYQTSITPTSATAGQSASYTYTVTKTTSTSTLGWVVINVPVGFTNTAITSVTASNGQGWTTAYSGNVITAHATASGGVLTSSSSTVQIIFTATAPTTAGTYGPFTSTAYQTYTGTGGPGTLSGTDPTVTVLPAGTKLVFTGVSQSLTVGTLSTPFTVQLQDANGNPTTTNVAISVSLATSSGGGEFYNNADGAESHEITTPITIAIGQSSSSNIWYRDLTAGSSTLTGSNNGFTSATTVFTITGNSEPGYSVSMSPAQALVGKSATFTITVTRQSSFLDDISYVTISIPSSFTSVTIANGSPTCTNGGTWTGSYANGVITLQASGTYADLEDGTHDAVTVTFTATPTSNGAYTFAIATYGHLASGTLEIHNMGPGTNTGSNPSVTVYTPQLTAFTIGSIATPQTSGTSFSVTLTALDQNNNPITSYNSNVPLAVSGGPTISPTGTTTSGWSNGVWTGTITLTGKGTSVTIIVNQGNTPTVTSNTFIVNPATPHIDKTATGTGSSNSITINFPATSSSGELIYITVAEGSSQSVSSITPSGYSFQHRSTVTLPGSNVVLETWWGVSTTASAQTITITTTGSTHSFSATAISIMGANTASPFDGNARTATGSGTSATISNSTNLGTNDLVIGALGLDNGGTGTLSATGSNTLITSASSSGGRQAADESQIVTSQTVTSSYSWTYGSLNWGIIQDAIKPA